MDDRSNEGMTESLVKHQSAARLSRLMLLSSIHRSQKSEEVVTTTIETKCITYDPQSDRWGTRICPNCLNIHFNSDGTAREMYKGNITVEDVKAVEKAVKKSFSKLLRKQYGSDTKHYSDYDKSEAKPAIRRADGRKLRVSCASRQTGMK